MPSLICLIFVCAHAHLRSPPALLHQPVLCALFIRFALVFELAMHLPRQCAYVVCLHEKQLTLLVCPCFALLAGKVASVCECLVCCIVDWTAIGPHHLFELKGEHVVPAVFLLQLRCFYVGPAKPN